MGACNDRLLQNVYETGFALDEATLYLDTHPTVLLILGIIVVILSAYMGIPTFVTKMGGLF